MHIFIQSHAALNEVHEVHQEKHFPTAFAFTRDSLHENHSVIYGTVLWEHYFELDVLAGQYFMRSARMQPGEIDSGL